MEYSKLSSVYEELVSTTKMLEKTEILSRFLKTVETADLEYVVLLLEGRVFPEWDSTKIGIGAQLTIKAIALSSGKKESEVTEEWRKTGDLGDVAQKLLSSKTQGTLIHQEISVNKVVENIRKLSYLEGKGTVSRKVGLLSELLSSANPVSAKYIVRTCLEDLRTGAGFGILRDSISKAFDVEKELVQVAYDKSTDLANVTKVAKENGGDGLKKFGITLGHPVKVMLFQKAKDFEDAFERVGKPASVQYKYDGFRLQIHRKGKDINLFTRRLEDVTKQFPDIVKAVKKDITAQSFIIDCEVVGYDPKSKRWRPFQEISQRIKRKYEIENLIKKLPVMIIAFDIIYLNNSTVISKPFSERSKLLNNIIKEDPLNVSTAKEIITSSTKEAERFYSKALSLGAEGVMIKNLSSPYKPGSRVGYGVKVKPIMDTLDLVITGAEWGTGKRATWLSSFVLSCLGPDGFLTIGKMGTGIKEKVDGGVSFHQLTKLLKPLITEEHGRTVEIKPRVVIEVAYEEIQKSPTYKSGFALRFPRLKSLRFDRAPNESDTISRVKELYSSQRGKKK